MDRATLQQLSCAVAARAIDVQLKAVAGDVRRWRSILPTSFNDPIFRFAPPSTVSRR
jgi:hypothetical protein